MVKISSACLSTTGRPAAGRHDNLFIKKETAKKAVSFKKGIPLFYAVSSCSSNLDAIACLETFPTIWSTTCPSLKNKSIGTLLIP